MVEQLEFTIESAFLNTTVESSPLCVMQVAFMLTTVENTWKLNVTLRRHM